MSKRRIKLKRGRGGSGGVGMSAISEITNSQSAAAVNWWFAG